MELYFLRHAIAEERRPGSDDARRALTEEGIAKMQRAARGIERLKLAPDLLISSPLVRAQQTAGIVAPVLGLDVQIADELAPGCDLMAVQQLLAAHTAQRVMLVGHEPDFSGILAELTGGQVEMRKGALARVDLRAVSAGSGVLVWLLPPRVLRAIGS